MVAGQQNAAIIDAAKERIYRRSCNHYWSNSWASLGAFAKLNCWYSERMEMV